MFRRSRRKIILSIMLSLILLFSVTLSVIMFASYREVRQQNTEMLERYVELYSLENQPGSQDGEEPMGSKPPDEPGRGHQQEKPPIDSRPDYQLSTFYSVAFGDDGTVVAVDKGEKDVYN